MPRSRSCASKSVTVVPLCTSPRLWMAPVANRMRSVIVVLPASTWARMPRLRTAAGEVVVKGRRLARMARGLSSDERKGQRDSRTELSVPRAAAATPSPPGPEQVRAGGVREQRSGRNLKVRHGHTVTAAQPAPHAARHRDHVVPGPGSEGGGAVHAHGAAPLLFTRHEVRGALSAARTASLGRQGARRHRIFRGWASGPGHRPPSRPDAFTRCARKRSWGHRRDGARRRREPGRGTARGMPVGLPPLPGCTNSA